MKQQKELHGFILRDKQEISEINVEAYVYEHQKSGAQIIFLDCEDTNKAFCITFKTPPDDNTGCPHILEHSVLNGSKHYPSKSPFQELIKGSLQTFLNAMTGSDRTMYPVASTNDKDFLNLMDVYADAVFFPKIYEKPEILAQEGWHHELLKPEDEIVYKGVVYNEMKGAFSSPEGLLFRLNQHAQFPDNAYGFESGGDPEFIPQLSQEKFCAFHSKYYHPVNSRIFLYGNLNIDNALKILNDKFLSHFERTEVDSDIPLHKAHKKMKQIETHYPVDNGTDPKGLCYLSLNFTFGDVHAADSVMGMITLVDILMNSPASPLKQAIQKSGFAADSFAYVDHRALQPSLSIVCKNVAEENLSALEALIFQELKRLMDEGIDKSLIEATLNSKEFVLREAQMQGFPKGLYYCFVINNTWLFDGDPFVYLRYEPLLKNLRRGLSEAYFESLIEKCILKNNYASRIIMKPEPGMNDRIDKATAEKLSSYKQSLSVDDIDKLIAENKALIAWQNAPEIAEDLAKIPFIELSDINPIAEIMPIESEVWKEFTLLRHEINTNGIVYLRTYFDLAHAEEIDLPWISLYTYLCGSVNTENYSFSELANETNIHTGGINVWLNLINDYQDPDQVIAKIGVSGKAIKAKSENLIELATEYALRPLFDDADRIKQLIRELRARLEMSFMTSGHHLAVRRLLSPYSLYHHWADITEGLAYYHFLCDLEKGFETNMDQIIEELLWVKKTYFTQRNLIISLTGSSEEIDHAFGYLAPMIANINSEAYAPVEHKFSMHDLNEAIYAPVNVQYCAKGGNFFRKGYSYTGKLRVLNSILRNEFLYNEIRVKGGAYGIMSHFSISGFQYFVSYRDPNLENTLEVYNQVPEFIRKFQCNRKEFEKYIIGEISSMDYPNTPERKAAISDEDFISGFTATDRQQIRNEVLSAKLEDMAAYADMIEAIMIKNHYCVFGNEAKIRAAEKLFDTVTPVFK